MEDLFEGIPDEKKLRLRDGSILHDTAIIPNFIAGEDADSTWRALLALVDSSPAPLELNFDNPRWVNGEGVELNYRGPQLSAIRCGFNGIWAACCDTAIQAGSGESRRALTASPPCPRWKPWSMRWKKSCV
jgi:hypothetical protein